MLAFAAAPTVLGLPLIWPVGLALRHGLGSGRAERNGALPFLFDLPELAALWRSGF